MTAPGRALPLPARPVHADRHGARQPSVEWFRWSDLRCSCDCCSGSRSLILN